MGSNNYWSEENEGRPWISHRDYLARDKWIRRREAELRLGREFTEEELKEFDDWWKGKEEQREA